MMRLQGTLEDSMDKGTIKTGVVQIGLGVSIAPK